MPAHWAEECEAIFMTCQNCETTETRAAVPGNNHDCIIQLKQTVKDLRDYKTKIDQAYTEQGL